jgi:hypothetical protein
MDDIRKTAIRGVPPLDESVRDESLDGYARLLRDIVYSQLRPDDRARHGTSDEPVFDEALRAVMERFIADNLRALTPGEFVAAYRSVNDDQHLAESLDALADVHGHAIAREIRFARLRQEASISGRLRLRDLTPDEVLTIGLFDPHRPELAARRHVDDQQYRPLHRVLQVRTVAPDRGAVELLRDTWSGPPWASTMRTRLVESLSHVRIGTLAPSDDAAELRAELSLHAPVTIVLESGGLVQPPQIVGYVETLDRQVLLDAA